MTSFNDQQRSLQNDLRKEIKNHTDYKDSELTREEISEVLEYETMQVEYGHEEEYTHLENLGKPVNEQQEEEQ